MEYFILSKHSKTIRRVLLYMLPTKELSKLIHQGLPILLIIIYLLFPDHFLHVSKHPLGKLIAVFAISIYTYYDMTHGLVICLLVILYYHQEMESFISKSGVNYQEYLPKPSPKDAIAMFENNIEKDYTHVDEAYPLNLPPIKKVSEAIFRKERCVQSKVQHKNQTLKNHLVTHIYPDLNFREGECNPCDETCHFTIQKKQAIEDKLKPATARRGVLIRDVLTLCGFPEKEPFGLKDTAFTPYHQ